MQNCREVANRIASDGLEYAEWPMRLVTRLHLLHCKYCRRYAREIAMIGGIGREAWSTDSVSTATVQRLEGSILDCALSAKEGAR